MVYARGGKSTRALERKERKGERGRRGGDPWRRSGRMILSDSHFYPRADAYILKLLIIRAFGIYYTGFVSRIAETRAPVRQIGRMATKTSNVRVIEVKNGLMEWVYDEGCPRKATRTARRLSTPGNTPPLMYP